MVKEHILGRTAESIQASTYMIRRTGMDVIPGLMVGSTKECGQIARDQGKEKSFILMGLKDRVFGRMTSDYIGQTTKTVKV